MSTSQLKKLAEKTAIEYYKSGKSGISFGSFSPEQAASMLARQAKSRNKLIKDIHSMQGKI